MEEIINLQKETLGINNFLNIANTYSENVFPDINMSDVFSKSIIGRIDNIFSLRMIMRIFLPEISDALSLMVNIIIIIIIHGIVKNVIENCRKTGVTEIIYFAEYLLIVNMIIESFCLVFDITKENINNLVNFMNLLIPLMTTLMLTTGSIVTTSVVQPVLIFIINFIGIFVDSFIIPMLMISITITIVSNISDKVQLEKLSKFLNSSIIWIFRNFAYNIF